MSCSRVRAEFSAYLDGDLSGARRELVNAHLASCAGCAGHLRELNGVSRALAALPRLSSPGLVSRVLDRLEVESRGPGLALLYRSAFAARPLMVPSLLPAALVVICTWSIVLMMGLRDFRSLTQAQWRVKPAPTAWGTEANPFWATGNVRSPQADSDVFVDEQLMGLGEQTFFVLTLVNPDGRVSEVKLLDGDSKSAAPILDELRLQRCAPGRDLAGRPVAMRSLRLISAMEVRAPRT